MSAVTVIGKAARWGVRRILRLYYPHIEVDGREHLPAKGAVLFVANHPNSLMDPAVIGFTAQRSVHFFAKAPLFDVPVFGTLMRALGMVPAYRGTDDKASVRKNLETLDLGAKYLQGGEAVGIFPEGKTHDRDGVEQIRTGAARIAWSAFRGGAQFAIVPLGLNYERKERFRSAVWVRVGEPLDATAWWHTRGEEERQAIRSLTEEIDSRLKRLVIHLHLDESRWEPFLPALETLLPPEDGESGDAIAALRQRKRFADAMNHWLATDRPRAEAAAAGIERFQAQLAKPGLTLDSPILWQGAARLTVRLLREFLWLTLGFGPASAGLLHHLVPFAVTRGLVRLIQHPGRATLALNRLMIGLPLYALWYAVVGWLLAIATQPWLAWLWIVLMPFCGLFALHYFWRLRHAGRASWQEVKMLMRPKLLRSLRAGYVALRRELQQLRKEYLARTR